MSNILAELNKRRKTMDEEFELPLEPTDEEIIVSDNVEEELEFSLDNETYEYSDDLIEDEESDEDPEDSEVEDPEPELTPDVPEVEEPAPIIVPDSSIEPAVEIEQSPDVELPPVTDLIENPAEIMMDTPLLMKIIDCVRKEIKTDEAAQQLVDKIEEMVMVNGCLSLSDYDTILESVPDPEPDPKESEIEEVKESAPSGYKEGATATNPTTGKRVILLGGTWYPHND